MKPANTNVAEELARSYRYICRFSGVIMWHGDKLWLISQLYKKDHFPVDLAESIFSCKQISPQELGYFLGANETIEINTSRLARLNYHLGRVERSHQLQHLIKEGAKPLRSLRHKDWQREIDNAQQTYEILSKCVTAIESIHAWDGLKETAPWESLWFIDAYVYGGNYLKKADSLLQQRSAALIHHLIDYLERCWGKNTRLCHLVLGYLIYNLHGADEQYLNEVRERLAAIVDSKTLTLLDRLRQTALVQFPYATQLVIANSEREQTRTRLNYYTKEAIHSVYTVARDLSLVCSDAVGIRVLEDSNIPYEEPLQRYRQLKERWYRLLEIYRGRHNTPLNKAYTRREQNLVNSLAALPAQATPAVHKLLDCVFRFLGRYAEAGIRPASRSELVRVLTVNWPQGIGKALEGLCRFWLQKVENDWLHRPIPQASSEAYGEKAAAIAFRALFPTLELDLPTKIDRAKLNVLLTISNDYLPNQLERLWPVIRELNGDQLSRLPENIFSTNFPTTLVKKAVDLYLISGFRYVVTHCQSYSVVKRYLEVAQWFTTHNLHGVDVKADWFLKLFTDKRPWVPALVLAWMGNCHKNKGSTKDLLLFHLLVKTVAEKAEPWMSQLFDEWHNVRVDNPPKEMVVLSQFLPLEELQQYLHYKRFIEGKECFSNELNEVVYIEDKWHTEQVWLEQQLNNTDLPPDKIKSLQHRLAALSDPQAIQALKASNQRRARNQLRRALDVLRAESIKVLLKELTAKALAEVFHRPIPTADIPDGFESVLILWHAEELDQTLWARFVETLIVGGSLNDWPENRVWLEKAQTCGLDIERWLSGINTTVQIDDQKFHIETEQRPEQVLLMGSYFDTCLGLEEGENAASTLTNAIDSNKQVIYVRRKDGAVIARKLIGIALDESKGEGVASLAGYHTYSQIDNTTLKRVIHKAAAEFAQNCGLILSDSATPQSLLGAFWYDDGNEAWQTVHPQNYLEQSSLKYLPAKLEYQTYDLAECHYLHTWDVNQTERIELFKSLENMSRDQQYDDNFDWYNSAYYWMAKTSLEREEQYLELDSWLAESVLLWESKFNWCLYKSEYFYDDLTRKVYEEALLEKDFIQTYAEFLQKHHSQFNYDSEYYNKGPWLPPAAIALLEPALLWRTFKIVLSLSYRFKAEQFLDEDYNVEWWEQEWGRFLSITTLTSKKSEGILRALKDSDEHAFMTGLNACRFVDAEPRILSELRRQLRRSLKQGGRHRCEQIALVLSSHADNKDLWFLEQGWRQWPESLALTVAVHRCVEPDDKGKIIDKWNAGASLYTDMDNRNWIKMLAELASPRLIDELEVFLLQVLSGAQGWDKLSFIRSYYGVNYKVNACLDLLLVVYSKQPGALKVFDKALAYYYGKSQKDNKEDYQYFCKLRECAPFWVNLWDKIDQGVEIDKCMIDDDAILLAEELLFNKSSALFDPPDGVLRKLYNAIVKGNEHSRNNALRIMKTVLYNRQRGATGLAELMVLLGDNWQAIPESINKELRGLADTKMYRYPQKETSPFFTAVFSSPDQVQDEEWEREYWYRQLVFPTYDDAAELVYDRALAFVLALNKDKSDPYGNKAVKIWNLCNRKDNLWLWELLDVAYKWLPPQRALELANEWVSNIQTNGSSAQEWMDRLFPADNNLSFRQHQLFAEKIWPDLDENIQEELKKKLSDYNHSRARWLLGLIS